MTKSRMTEGKIPNRREIGTKKVSKVLTQFLAQKFHTRAMELLGEDWKSAIASMSGEEMPAPLQEGNEALLDDDNFHVPESDHWWEHETYWFWFFNAERKLGCWSYHYVRPTIGVAGGGVFLFDDTAWFHMETPYYVNYTNTRLPDERDARDFTFPSGQRIQMLAPNEHYKLGLFWCLPREIDKH